MREMIKMVVVLTILSSLSGGLLSIVRDQTKEKIENQQLKFEKAPAVRKILQGVSNDPLKDRFKLKYEKREITFFVGIINDKPYVAFEDYGKGFSGDIGVMVGVDLETDKIIGIGVTTHSETPGVGSKAKTAPDLPNQFKDLSVLKPILLKADDGTIDAISGATITSRGVCLAITKAGILYTKLKPEIINQVKKFQ